MEEGSKRCAAAQSFEIDCAVSIKREIKPQIRGTCAPILENVAHVLSEQKLCALLFKTMPPPLSLSLVRSRSLGRNHREKRENAFPRVHETLARVRLLVAEGRSFRSDINSIRNRRPMTGSAESLRSENPSGNKVGLCAT